LGGGGREDEDEDEDEEAVAEGKTARMVTVWGRYRSDKFPFCDGGGDQQFVQHTLRWSTGYRVHLADGLAIEKRAWLARSSHLWWTSNDRARFFQ
jgi:hypothetical protein